MDKKSQFKYRKTLLIIMILIAILCLYFVSAPISQGDEKEPINDSNIIKQNYTLFERTASTDIYRDSEGNFHKIYYFWAVNIEYNNSYIPFEDYLNISEDNGKIKLETLSGDKCFIELEYEKKNTLSISNNKIDIKRYRGNYYFTTNVSTEVNTMNYKLNCSNYSISFAEDELYLDNLIIDFSKARIEQNISSSFNKEKGILEFKPIGKETSLSFIDPSVYYNYSSATNKLYYNSTELCATLPLNRLSPEDSSTNASKVAVSDDVYWQSTTTGATSSASQFFLFKIDEEVDSITSLNVTYQGYGSGASFGGGNFSIWKNNAYRLISRIGSTNSNLSKNFTSDFGDYINNTGYLALSACFKSGGGGTPYSLFTNFVGVTVNYYSIYPKFSAYWDNNASLVNSGTGKFNVTVDNTNGTVIFEIDNTNITASLGLSSLCYQESANVSTACGGLNTGSYAFNGTWTFSSNNVIDSNWSSYGAGASSPNSAFVYMNYTKPIGAGASSLWQVKDENATVNLTLPSSCWFRDKLELRVFSNSPINTNMNWSCWSGTSWVNLRGKVGLSGNYWNIYEEAMIWNISYYNVSYNFTSGGIYPYKWHSWGGSDNNYNVSDTKSYTVNSTSATTCTCPSLNSNWGVSLSDYCYIDANCEIGTGNLSFINTGNFTCNANINITNLNNSGLGTGSTMWLKSGCILNLG